MRAGMSFETRGLDEGLANIDLLPARRLGLHVGTTVRLGHGFEISAAYAHLFQETIEVADTGEPGGAALAPDGGRRHRPGDQRRDLRRPLERLFHRHDPALLPPLPSQEHREGAGDPSATGHCGHTWRVPLPAERWLGHGSRRGLRAKRATRSSHPIGRVVCGARGNYPMIAIDEVSSARMA